MPSKRRGRLEPPVFKIPTDKIRSGYYSDRYFTRTQEVLLEERHVGWAEYQFFSREDGIVCGLDEAIAILKTCAGFYDNPLRAKQLYRRLRRAQWKLQNAAWRQNKKSILRWQREREQLRAGLNEIWVNGWQELEVSALYDGDRIKKGGVVLTITGDPRLFVHLETVLLGVLARPTAIATQVDRVVQAACGKPVLFFSARFDHYWVQATDGYAALKAGAFAVSTDANADYWGSESMGTIPHSLIACYEGHTDRAFMAFDRRIPPSVNRVALVDWDNDCIATTRTVIEALIIKEHQPFVLDEKWFRKYAPTVIGKGRGKLWAVRFDTSEKLYDRSVKSRGKTARGVSAELVRKARQTFDRWGCKNLKIIVSGGFDDKKIARFEKAKLPVHAYGVGSFLMKKRIDMTADIVGMNGKACAKVGRRKSDWSRLEKVT